MDAAPRFDVVGFGACCVDVVSRLPSFPEAEGPRSKVRITRQTIRCGGQVATAMTACARLGLRAAFVGTAGSDAHGALVRNTLAGNGVDVRWMITREAPTATAFILIDDRSGERIVLWSRDDGLALGASEVPWGAIESARLVHVDDVDPAGSIRIAGRARAAGVNVTSDIDHVDAHTAALVDAVDTAIFTDHVPGQLTGEPELESALRALGRRHAGCLCVTMGATGAMLLERGRLIVSPGFDVCVVDTTGAGDVFRAGWIYGTLQGWPIEAVLRFANAAAAVSCTREGAIDGAPALDEVNALLNRAGA